MGDKFRVSRDCPTPHTSCIFCITYIKIHKKKEHFVTFLQMRIRSSLNVFPSDTSLEKVLLKPSTMVLLVDYDDIKKKGKIQLTPDYC